LLPRRMRRAAAHRVAREQFIRRGLGMQPDQAAGGALDHLKYPVSSAVEPVSPRKQEPDYLMTARGAGTF